MTARRLHVVLGISIGLNLALALAIGSFVFGGRGPVPFARQRNHAPDQFIDPARRREAAEQIITARLSELKLTTDQQERIKARISAMLDKVEACAPGSTEVRAKDIAALVRDPETSGTVEQLVRRNRSGFETIDRLMLTGLRDVALILTPQQREQLAEKMVKETRDGPLPSMIPIAPGGGPVGGPGGGRGDGKNGDQGGGKGNRRNTGQFTKTE